MSHALSEYRLVRDQAILDELCQRIEPAGRVAVDTEFIRESTYYPQLCLLQIATADTIAAVDCLADIDTKPLFDALHAGGKPWILHSARQDLEVVAHYSGRLPAKLVDTQIAASLLGFPLQVGLQPLVADVLGVALGKEHTRADWSRRPLADAVLDYALDDVRYLLGLSSVLEERLAALGRLSWLEEDCARQLALPIYPDSLSILERTRGAGGLRGAGRATALALVEWREARARAADRPRRWILPDDQIVAIALAMPQTPAELAAIPGLTPRLLKRSGEALLGAVAGAGRAPERADSAPPDKTVMKRLQAEVKARAEALGIQTEVLATRREIGAVAQGITPETMTVGWRGGVLADLGRLVSQDRAP